MSTEVLSRDKANDTIPMTDRPGRLGPPAPGTPETIRVLALGLTFITGFSGLVYEVTWHKYLSNLMGSQAQARAVVLAVFLGGLSAGYGIFGRASLSRGPRILLLVYGIVEIATGLWALFFPLLYQLVWRNLGLIDRTLPHGAFPDILASVILIAVPTVLMGATVPLITQSLSRDLRESRSLHGKVHAINTFGAFGGGTGGRFADHPRARAQWHTRLDGAPEPDGGPGLSRVRVYSGSTAGRGNPKARG